MGMMPPAKGVGALVLDASVVVALATKETGTSQKADTEIRAYTAVGFELYAPGALVTEVLYVLCKRVEEGVLLPVDYVQALQDFNTFVVTVEPSPDGDFALAARAQAIGVGYSCRRSADGIYIALAEALSHSRPTVLLTFDKDMPKQAARNAPSVTVKLLR